MNEAVKLDFDEILDDELAVIRGRRWVNYLLKAGGFKTKAALHDALSVTNNVQSWSQYSKDEKPVQPLDSTVITVDAKIPGSADVWFKGYEELPLWDVLSRDRNHCLNYLEDFFANAHFEDWMLKTKKTIKEMNDSERLYSMLQLVIDKEHWGVKQAFSQVKATTSLNEILDLDDNLISECYEAQRDTFKKNKRDLELFIGSEISPEYGYKKEKHKTFIKSHHKKNNNLSNPSYVLALIALYFICDSSREKLGKAPGYIKQGISNAVLDTFGDEVHSYVMKI